MNRDNRIIFPKSVAGKEFRAGMSSAVDACEYHDCREGESAFGVKCLKSQDFHYRGRLPVTGWHGCPKLVP